MRETEVSPPGQSPLVRVPSGVVTLLGSLDELPETAHFFHNFLFDEVLSKGVELSAADVTALKAVSSFLDDLTTSYHQLRHTAGRSFWLMTPFKGDAVAPTTRGEGGQS